MDALSLRLTLAYLLDLALGDPRWLPHPVRGLGWVIEKGEAFFRRAVRNEERAGGLLVLTVVGGTWLLVQGTLALAHGWAAWAGTAIEVLLLYACLSTQDLVVETLPVYRALRRGDLALARAKVRMIVGRDTDRLDEAQIVRASVETVGESAMDGIVAPLFYAAVGGTGLACVYKAVNTLDSMIGYRSARYIRFGKVAAQVDRAMNKIPAWLTAGMIALSAPLVGFSARGAAQAVLRDAVPTKENSFFPEAAMAGALGVRLGGVNVYEGKPVEVPRLGDGNAPLKAQRIVECLRLMVVCSILSFLLVIVLRMVGGRLWGA